GGVTHDRRQKRIALSVGQHDRDAAPDGGDQRTGRAEIDADGKLALVRRRLRIGFGNLQQRHQTSTSLNMPSISAASLTMNLSSRTSVRASSHAASTSINAASSPSKRA